MQRFTSERNAILGKKYFYLTFEYSNIKKKLLFVYSNAWSSLCKLMHVQSVFILICWRGKVFLSPKCWENIPNDITSHFKCLKYSLCHCKMALPVLYFFTCHLLDAFIQSDLHTFSTVDNPHRSNLGWSVSGTQRHADCSGTRTWYPLIRSPAHYPLSHSSPRTFHRWLPDCLDTFPSTTLPSTTFPSMFHTFPVMAASLCLYHLISRWH